jgi:exoribonuclease R
MKTRRVRLATDAEELTRGFEHIRQDMDLPDRFPEDVQQEAERLADPTSSDVHADRRAIEFLSIDPPGSKDLDQAFHAERESSGYLVHYAIADVGSFVAPGSALDRESHRRGQTLYCPDIKIPLYPPVLSDDGASLLPERDRPAVLWSMHLDPEGRPTKVEVQRAIVRNRRQLTYEEAQAEIAAGDTGPLALLKEVGELRLKLEQGRGGINLNVPDQEVVKAGSGYWLSFRAPLPVEEWNAQISLMTGMAGAEMMLEGNVGLLRTMPPPTPETIQRLRHSAMALGLEWPEGLPYADFVRRLDARVPEQAALATQATQLFRGVAYTAFEGKAPTDANHHAIAAPYAHVTAPLRRLADRYANEIVLSLAAKQAPPEWCTEALPTLAEEMKESDRRDGELERRIIDLVEAVVLSDRRGEDFDAVVVEVNKRGGLLQLKDPAVLAPSDGNNLELGQSVKARLAEVDPARGQLRFQVVE